MPAACQKEGIVAVHDHPHGLDGPELPPIVTIAIERMDGGPALVIEDATQLAWDFFTRDASSVGRYAFDARVGRTDPDRIVTADLVAINTTMRARSPHTAWAAFLDTPEPLSWLARLGTRTRLFAIEDDDWQARWGAALGDAITTLIGPYRNLSVATKVLHAKRPALFPVLDRLVVEQLGGINRTPGEVLGHVREVGRANASGLMAIAATLDKVEIARSEVRILDALLWSSHPASSLPFATATWQRRMVPLSGPG